MSINWIYFSDTNSPPGEIDTHLEKQQFSLFSTNVLDKLHSLLIQNNQSVLFLKANTFFNVYDLCQEISVLYPHVYIILIVPDNMENLKKAMLMGASDTLRSSFQSEELLEAINHAKKYMSHRENKDKIALNINRKGKVIAISSPKGGVGRTLLTVNLAVALAKMGKKVAVIDGNLQFGEVAIYYNKKPKKSIYEWVKEGYGHNGFTIDQYVTPVDEGVSILAAPPRPEFFEGISEIHIKAAIEEAMKLFDFVLVDMPVNLSDIHLRYLDMADEIVLVTVNDLTTIRISKLYLETLEAIRLNEKVKLVINRQIKGQGLEIKRVEEIFGMKVYQTLPDQVNVASNSIKTGEPFILSSSRSHLGKAVWKLAENLLVKESKEAAEVKKEKRWFSVGK